MNEQQQSGDPNATENAAQINTTTNANQGQLSDAELKAAKGAPDTVSDAQAIKQHILDAKAATEQAEQEAYKTIPVEHHNDIREMFGKVLGKINGLVHHSNHNVENAEAAAEAQQQQTAQNAGIAPGALRPATTATSDAHLNRGNGGPVTGNPAASFSQASAAQVAVDQGAEIPGVAKVPQPDAAVR
jgi:hypothetical protein